MATLQELLAQQAALDAQIKDLRTQAVSDAVAKVQAIIAEFELTEKDIFGKGGVRKSSSGNKVAAKYRDPESGKEWTGRGIAPKWLQGKDRTQYLIA